MKRFDTTNARTRKLPAALAIVATLACQVALATEPAPAAYRMAAISDQAHGDELIRGDYERVIEELESASVHRSAKFWVRNNLCVAYTLVKDVEKAMRACEEAVVLSRKVARSRDTLTEQNRLRDIAVALSNRGVIRALTADMVSAKNDFETAIQLRVRLKEPVVNLAKLEMKKSETVAAS
ncbi:MAG: hypothetical protein HKN70_14875 [Gammaproteobacteria bacterium]|nr:hypothetical protein [Gammaproteobacteria bacterium]